MGSARRLLLMLSSLAAALAGVAGVAWLADPNHVWGHQLVADRYKAGGYAPCLRDQHERVITPYRLRVARPQRVLIGSSRMLCGVPVLPSSSPRIMNAALPGATLPELAAVIRTAAAANPELEEIISGLDFYPFSAQVQESQDASVFARLDGSNQLVLADAARTLQENLLNLEVLRQSWLILWRRAEGRLTGSDAPPTVPWDEAAIAADGSAPGSRLDAIADAALKAQIRDLMGIHWQYRYAPAVAARLRAAIDAARQRGVRVTGVVFPISACEYETIRALGLLPAWRGWKRALLEVVGPYWDFSGSAASRTPALFTDSLHLRPGAGHALLRRVLGLPCDACGARAQLLYDAGVLVDATTIASHLAAEVEDPVDARCATLVAEVVAVTPP